MSAVPAWAGQQNHGSTRCLGTASLLLAQMLAAAAVDDGDSAAVVVAAAVVAAAGVAAPKAVTQTAGLWLCRCWRNHRCSNLHWGAWQASSTNYQRCWRCCCWLGHPGYPKKHCFLQEVAKVKPALSLKRAASSFVAVPAAGAVVAAAAAAAAAGSGCCLG